MVISGTDPDTQQRPHGDRTVSRDATTTFPTHHRGHGSFSASTVRSPVSGSASIGGSPGKLGQVSSSKINLQSLDNESAVDTSSAEKPAVHRLNASGSVQAVVVDDNIIFAGLQGGEIVAWSLETYEQLARIHAHQQSVLGLSLSEDHSLLFSSGVDSTVNVYSTQNLQRLYSLESYFEVGDIFCVSYSPRIKTVFCGAQNSSIQWYKLPAQPLSTNTRAVLPESRRHRFFDSLGPGGTPSETPLSESASDSRVPQGGHWDTISQANYLQYAHKSYIYSMLLAKGLSESEFDEETLITAGGGGTIKLWNIDHLQSQKPTLQAKFKNKGSSVLSLAFRAPFLYAGLSSGVAHIYSLSSRQLVQRLSVTGGDVLQIQICGGDALCGTGEGWVQRTCSRFAETDRWRAHKGKILATAIAQHNGQNLLLTGGNDNSIAVWDLAQPSSAPSGSAARSNDELVNALRQFVSFRSVSSNTGYVSECHQAADFLRKQFNAFGASTSFISPQEDVNPILLAKFEASTTASTRKTVLFYGHYDVIDAESNNDWHTDPFTLHPLDGYLYGRGVTDNKGPILAALYAVSDLTQHEALSCNVVFLLEGDEEAGSRGFRSAVQKHKDEIGPVDFIVLSNSYWLDDHIPCLTFGMRGVVHASVTIVSDRPDLHSGMDGKSLQHEPLKDLTALLASLIGESGTDIRIPDFYDAVDDLQPGELDVYSKITSTLGRGHPEIKNEHGFTASLMQRWRDPSLTVHQIQVPESKTAVTISRSAKATLSVRIVPSQTADEVATQLLDFLHTRFETLQSTNTLRVQITSKADPWLGKISSEMFTVLKEAVTEVWSSEDSTAQRSFPPHSDSVTTPGKRPLHRRGSSLMTVGTFIPSDTPREPLLIREGGSIPAISFLEKEFQAPAAMFPMGQASDNAHLNNERIRLENLYKGREVLKKVFTRL